MATGDACSAAESASLFLNDWWAGFERALEGLRLGELLFVGIVCTGGRSGEELVGGCGTSFSFGSRR